MTTGGGGYDELFNRSPDGTMLAFDRITDGVGAIYTTSATGVSHLRRLTPSPYDDDYWAVWSPDGKKIAFDRTGGSAFGDIWVMNADGSGQKRLTESPADDFGTTWAPDGSMIAFLSNRTGRYQIYEMSSGGGHQQQLNDGAGASAPRFSPDGTQIVYEQQVGANEQIFVMSSNGENPRQLTHTTYDNTDPAWSPDGKSVAFLSARNGGTQVFEMGAAGSHQHRVSERRSFARERRVYDRPMLFGGFKPAGLWPVRWFAFAASATLVMLGFAGRSAPNEAAAVPTVSIRVVGNHLVDGAGRTVQLRGVDRSGTEFSCTGDSGSDGWSILDTPASVTDQQNVDAIASWDVNAVRIPLNEDCWLGINGVPSAYSGANYRTAVYGFVQLLHGDGMAAILDLHYNAPGSQVSDSTDGPYGIGQQTMADASHAVTFWKSVATVFLSDPGVVFDLYNEPFGISWSCLRDGGCNAPAIGGNAGGWPVAGMQALVTAVRSVGATQPIMVGGINYANDLSQWLTYEPADTLQPAQIIASFHDYDGEACAAQSCWDATVAPVAAQVPVVTGEFGPGSCDGVFANAYMNWADAHGVSYLAWNWGSTADGWSCADSPALLLTDDGTPDAYGAAVRAHYLAAGPSPGLPGAPTDVTATAGDREATVTFTAPSSDGGAALTGYTATASPGGRAATGVSPIFVSGLTDGTSYTFTVTAANAIGAGPPSSPSAPVIPAADGSRPGPAPPALGVRPGIPAISAPAGTRPAPPGQ